jgi:Phenazine biosynthesis-like protein
MIVRHIAAFSDGLTGGNPAGVVICKTLPTAFEMQQIAANVGFSETAFCEPIAGRWRVRYFSPETEVPFCGHATIALGAALAMDYGDGVFGLTLNSAEITVEGQRNGETFADDIKSVIGVGLFHQGDNILQRLLDVRVHAAFNPAPVPHQGFTVCQKIRLALNARHFGHGIDRHQLAAVFLYPGFDYAHQTLHAVGLHSEAHMRRRHPFRRYTGLVQVHEHQAGPALLQAPLSDRCLFNAGPRRLTPWIAVQDDDHARIEERLPHAFEPVGADQVFLVVREVKDLESFAQAVIQLLRDHLILRKERYRDIVFRFGRDRAHRSFGHGKSFRSETPGMWETQNSRATGLTAVANVLTLF